MNNNNILLILIAVLFGFCIGTIYQQNIEKNNKYNDVFLEINRITQSPLLI
jgi:hypothetical protein